MARQRHLVQKVDALRATGRFAGALDGRHQHGDQDADDGNYHQQLDKRESRANLTRANLTGASNARLHRPTSL
jgi:hypothetical protein